MTLGKPRKVTKKVKDLSVIAFRIVFKEYWWGDGERDGFHPGKIHYLSRIKIFPRGKRIKNHDEYVDPEDLKVASGPCIEWYSDYLRHEVHCPLSKIKSIVQVRQIRKTETIETTGEEILRILL